MARYRKKPVEVEAFRLSVDDMPDWFKEEIDRKIKILGGDIACTIETLDGCLAVWEGDYIIKGIHGEIYSCSPEAFEETYERIQDK